MIDVTEGMGRSGWGVSAAGARSGSMVRDAGGFAARLRAAEPAGAGSEVTPAARRAAEDLVSAALVKPILAQVRSSDMAAPPFGGGLWERQFGPMLDAAWADAMVRSSSWGVVDAVARGLMVEARASAAATDGGADGPGKETA